MQAAAGLTVLVQAAMICTMIRGVLLDLAGVLYDAGQPVRGSAEAVERLRTAGLPVRFVTNSTRSPRRVLLEKLDKMGFRVDADELFTPARAACDTLRVRGHAPHLLIHPDLAEDFKGLEGLGPEISVVVGDAGRFFAFDNLNAAFRRLADGAGFLALAANRTFRDSDGEISMDAGAFVAALEYASEVKAEVLGKPSPAFFAAALASMGCAAQDAVMIGDDAEADVAGALDAGLGAAVLVRTGKYHAGDEAKIHPAPSHVANNLAAAVDWVLKQSADRD